MPGYKGHLVGGAIAYGITLIVMYPYCSSVFIAAQWLGCTLAGSLFPDIDIKSKGQKYFYWGIALVFGILIAMQQFKLLAACSICSVLPMLVNHRGLFHRVWFIIAVPFGCWVIISSYYPLYTQSLFFYAMFFTIGAFSHVWLDLGLRQMLRRW